MLFNSVTFLIFFPIVVLGYYILPAKVRYLWLLAASYYFYMQWNAIYILLLLGCTCITFTGGILLERCRRHRGLILTVCLCICLGILFYYKYFGFAVDLANQLLRFLRLPLLSYRYDIVLPVGISFFTLQSLGYLIDVYRGDVYAEKNFFKYALFVSFFPQLVAGPIERSRNLLKQLDTPQPFSFDHLCRGLLLVLYGLFLKVVIADRAAILVNTVYNQAALYPGYYIVVATIFFALQIYCDFYGYSVIARGAALTMGIRLVDNFNAPYLSKSIKEYWSRWHISLSTWFRDYLYIPLGGNRKGKARRFLNLLIVFMVSGLWHGASLSFVFWGLLNAIYQIVGELREMLLKRLKVTPLPDSFSKRLFRTIGAFILFDFSWLFFRAGGLKPSFLVLKSMFSVNNYEILFNGDLYTLGIDRNYMMILLLAILVLFAVDRLKYQGKDVVSLFFSQGILFRLIATMALIFAILLFGCYGEMYDVQQFIYFQF